MTNLMFISVALKHPDNKHFEKVYIQYSTRTAKYSYPGGKIDVGLFFVDECVPNPCGDRHHCISVDNIQGYTCNCIEGFIYDGDTCIGM